MKKNTKIRITSSLVALLMATNINLVKNNNVKAEEERYIAGTYTEEVEEPVYNEYVVREGDNASVISIRVCKYFGVPKTTKYWPVIAYLNNYPRVLQPNDIIYFPETFEEMDTMLNDLKESGWLRLYLKYNKVYGKKEEKITVGEVIDDIYGIGACKDPDFVLAYFTAIEQLGNYNVDSVVKGDDLFRLTEWIPTREELKVYQKRK